MNAKELGEKLLEHPEADVMCFGDEMSTSTIGTLVYDESQNVFYLYHD